MLQVGVTDLLVTVATVASLLLRESVVALTVLRVVEPAVGR